jgi:hypothetical protein
MVKAELFEVSTVGRSDVFTLKLEMLDLEDFIPRTGEKFVLLTFKEYEELTGKKPVIKLKPKRKKK